VNAQAKDGSTLLHVAASRGAAKVAHMLLKHGANLEAKDNNDWTRYVVQD